MAWEFNGSAWGFSEFGREDDDRPAALVGSSSLGPPMDGGFFSVDLKLGRLGKIGDGSVGKLKEPKSSSISPSPSGSSKRTRVTNGIQNILCLVDGCTADLTNSREYHRRHRVCEHHSKTPVVMVGGKEQRFCQQCSRFQSLAEFDGEKRSCRKRLDGHNRRRRKPQPEAFFMSSGSFLSIHQGTRFLQFGGSQLYTPSTTGVVPNWPGDAKHKQDQQSTFPYSAASIYKGGDKQFPFLLANDPEGCNLAVSIFQQLVNTSASTERGTGHRKMPSDGLIPSANSNRALSLLSSHSEQNVIHQIQPHRAQSIGTGLQFDGLAQYPGGGQASRVHSAGWQCQHSLP